MKFIWNEHKSIFLHFPLIFLWFFSIGKSSKIGWNWRGKKLSFPKTEFRLNNFITTSNFQHLLLMHLWNHYPRTSFLKREYLHIRVVFDRARYKKNVFWNCRLFLNFVGVTFKIRKFKWNKKFQIYTPQLLGMQHFFEFCRSWYSWFNRPKGWKL